MIKKTAKTPPPPLPTDWLDWTQLSWLTGQCQCLLFALAQPKHWPCPCPWPWTIRIRRTTATIETFKHFTLRSTWAALRFTFECKINITQGAGKRFKCLSQRHIDNRPGAVTIAITRSRYQNNSPPLQPTKRAVGRRWHLYFGIDLIYPRSAHVRCMLAVAVVVVVVLSRRWSA